MDIQISAIQMVDDLTTEFLEYYQHGDARPAVADYGAYFMGSIVLAGRENAIIDGQQRFSSLTLLLMYIFSLILSDLISDSRYPFNISVDVRLRPRSFIATNTL